MNFEGFFAKLGLYYKKSGLFYPVFVEKQTEIDDDRMISYYFLSGWRILPTIKHVYRQFMTGDGQNLREIYKVWYKRKVKNGKYN